MSIKRLMKYLMLLLACMSMSYANAQSYIASNDNYSGSMGALLNPSLMTTSYLYADIGINASLIAYNDFFRFGNIYGYIKNLKNDGGAMFPQTINGKTKYFYFDFPYGDWSSKYMNVAADVVWLHGMYSGSRENSFGFFLRTRANVGYDNMSGHLIELMSIKDHLEVSDFLKYSGNYDSKNLNVSTVGWSEAAFSYSRILHERYLNKVDFGFNAKFLLGHCAMVVNLENFNYGFNDTLVDGNLDCNLMDINDLNGSLCYSLPMDYDNGFTYNGNPIVGLGAGLDIGFTYTRKLNSKEVRKGTSPCLSPKTEYLWKLGLSVLDIGFISFNSAEKSTYKTGGTTLNLDAFSNPKSLHALVDTLDANLDGVREKGNILIGTPTAVSLQFDWNINDRFYLNAVVIQPISQFLYKYSSRRAAQIVLAPRYESRWFSFTLPVTLYDYKKVMVGASIRAAYITIGTQNLLNILGLANTDGLDFYVTIKYNFERGKCASKRDACWSSDFGSPKRHSY